MIRIGCTSSLSALAIRRKRQSLGLILSRRNPATFIPLGERGPKNLPITLRLGIGANSNLSITLKAQESVGIRTTSSAKYQARNGRNRIFYTRWDAASVQRMKFQWATFIRTVEFGAC